MEKITENLDTEDVRVFDVFFQFLENNEQVKFSRLSTFFWILSLKVSHLLVHIVSPAKEQ